MSTVDLTDAKAVDKIMNAADQVREGTSRIDGPGWKVYDTKTPSKDGNKVIRIDVEVDGA